MLSCEKSLTTFFTYDLVNLMRRKKSSAPKKRGKGKQRTFLSLFIVAALAITIGLPLTLKFNSTQNPSQKVAAITDTVYASVSQVTFSNTSGSTNCANIVNTSGPVFASTYTVNCFSKAAVTRKSPGGTCQTGTSLLADAKSFCESTMPTPTSSTATQLKPPVPCKISGAGDVNFDGYVTNKDVLLVQEFAIGKKTPTASQLLRADINGTKTITSADLAAINAYSLGKIKTFPICGTTPTPTYTPNNPWKTPTPGNPWGATITPTSSVTTVCPNFPGNGTQNICVTGSKCPTGYSVYGSATNNACGTGKLCCNK